MLFDKGVHLASAARTRRKVDIDCGPARSAPHEATVVALAAIQFDRVTRGYGRFRMPVEEAKAREFDPPLRANLREIESSTSGSQLAS